MDCGGGSGALEESSSVDGRSITTPMLSNHGGPRQEDKQSRYREKASHFWAVCKATQTTPCRASKDVQGPW